MPKLKSADKSHEMARIHTWKLQGPPRTFQEASTVNFNHSKDNGVYLGSWKFGSMCDCEGSHQMPSPLLSQGTRRWEIMGEEWPPAHHELQLSTGQ